MDVVCNVRRSYRFQLFKTVLEHIESVFLVSFQFKVFPLKRVVTELVLPIYIIYCNIEICIVIVYFWVLCGQLKVEQTDRQTTARLVVKSALIDANTFYKHIIQIHGRILIVKTNQMNKQNVLKTI